MNQPASSPQLHVRDMDELDARILDHLQNKFPLVREPFKAIAEAVGTTETEVLARTRAYCERQVIRQLSAIFDTKSLGYRSSLVAAKYPAARLDEGAEVINGHPGVSHNYARNHEFNLWFTLAVPPNSKLGLEETAAILERESGAEKLRLLPTLRLFKIGVDLDISGTRDATEKSEAIYTEADRAKTTEVSDQEILVIRHTQGHMPIESRPFDRMAEAAGLPVETLIETLVRLQGRGQLRRIAAVLFHRKMGFRANAMGVWKVPVEKVDTIGPQMGSYRNVSHCYLRPTYPDWPYNVFTMIHAQTAEDCEKILDAISDETGVMERSSLYSTKEYKKTRVPYFTSEMDAWEASRV